MKALAKRIERIETAAGIGFKLPTLFLSITDAGIPDADAPADGAEMRDSAVIGVVESMGWQRVSRHPGEELEALMRRAGRTLPKCRVFQFSYSTITDSKAAFEGAVEGAG